MQRIEIQMFLFSNEIKNWKNDFLFILELEYPNCMK